MLDQFPQLPDEAFGHCLDSLSRVYFIAVGPFHLKSPISHAPVYFDQILASTELAARQTNRIVGEGERCSLVIEDLIELSQIVETHLRLREFFQLTRDRFLAAQIPEQTVANASVRHPPQLLLYRLQRLARPGRITHLQQHREDCREPSDGPGKITAFDDLFSPVPFNIHQHSVLSRPL